jgi:opacity protein-like surface antigen
MLGTARIVGALAAALALCALPAAAAAKAVDDGTDWGLVARGGVYGVPDVVLDELFVRHPGVDGTFVGAELRYFGDGGGRGVSSIGIAVDRGSAEGDGTWQSEETDRAVVATGAIEMTAITLTGYWSLFPSWPLHPYVGLGLGGAYFGGEYTKDGERIDVSTWLPVVHVPVGLALELGRLQLSAEARFLGGFTGGAALLLRF